MNFFELVLPWLIGVGTGYCLHTLVAISVCPEYKDYFFRKIRRHTK